MIFHQALLQQAERGVDVIRLLMRQGQMVKITDVIDADTAQLLAEEMGHTVKRVAESDVEEGLFDKADDPDSPHHKASAIKAAVYVAGAIEDQSFTDEQTDLLENSFRGRPADRTRDLGGGQPRSQEAVAGRASALERVGFWLARHELHHRGRIHVGISRHQIVSSRS